MKIDEDILSSAPKKPSREDFDSEEEFEECLGYWMSHVGKVLSIQQQIRNSTKKNAAKGNKKTG